MKTPIPLNKISCDLLVVGAGPAGSCAAAAAAEGGLEVVVIEKRPVVGLQVECAEYVPRLISSYTGIALNMEEGPDLIAQPIELLRTTLPNGESTVMSAAGYVLHRDRFDQALAERAERLGARFLLATEALSYQDGLVYAGKTGNEKKSRYAIQARIIIGADGPRSRVGRWIGNGSSEVICSKQVRVPLKAYHPNTEVFFAEYIPGGYGWLFPKGETANAGVGLDPRFAVSVTEVLDRFLEDLTAVGLIQKKILSRTGGLIPVGGLVATLCRGNVLLAGDAAGQCHPITGAGIANAVLGGRAAGELAARALRSGNPESLREYEETCRELFGGIFANATKKRAGLMPYWSAGSGHLTRALKSGWIAYRGYYE